MYCKNCSYALNGTEKYCPNCGKKVNYKYDDSPLTIKDNSLKSEEKVRTTSITLGLISLFGLFLGIFAPISLVLSIIGLFLAIRSSKKATNTAGIILNAISLFISTIITIFIGIVIYFIITEGKRIPDFFDEYIPINEIYHEENRF